MPSQPISPAAADATETPCGRCGAPVRAWPAERARGGGRYCSRACFAAARSTREERACVRCGLRFRAHACAISRGGGIYCGPACAKAAAPGTTRPGLRTGVAVACAICGTERSVRPSVLALGAGLYCSRACANIGKRSPGRGLRDPAAWVSSTCLHCERERMIPRSRAVRGDGRYCDRACGDAARRGEGAGVPRADGHTVARRSDGTWDLAHRVAMEVILGRRLTRIEDVRHRNGDPGDDDPANLELETLPVPVPGRPRRRRAARWARGHDACIRCHAAGHPHRGHGLCRLCYSRQRREAAPDAHRVQGARTAGHEPA